MKFARVHALTVFIAGILLNGICLAAQPAANGANLASGLVLHLPLTTNFSDRSDHQHEIEAHGEVLLRDGAAYFPGKNAWVELPHLPLNERPFAIAMWVRPTGNEQIYGLLEQRDTNERNKLFHLQLRSDLQPYMGFFGNDLIGPGSIPRNGWTHLLFQFDGTFQEIWINGHRVCRRRAVGAYEGKAGLTRLGRSPRWTNMPIRDFEGYMCGVRFYDRSLVMSEVAELQQLDVPDRESRRPRPTRALDTLPAGTAPTTIVRAPLPPHLLIDGIKLTITGRAGDIYELQTTADLGLPWEALVTVTNSTGEVQIVDRDAEKIPQRFYRIRVQ